MALTTVRPQGMGFNTGRRNMVINGAMQVAQRGTSTSFAHDGTTNAYSLDRFQVVFANADELDFTVTQDSDAPDDFGNSLKVTTGTAESSIASDEYVFMRTKMEGQNLQHLKYGTSAAVSTTVSFYVKSSQTGTFGISMYSADGNRNIGTTYTINSANTWEYKTATFAGDTSGTINNDNGDALNVIWHLASGSDFDSTDNTSWGAYSNARWAFGHAQDGVVTTASATWQITGIQFEVGENASDFEHRSFGEELALCQRYAYMIGDPVNSGQRDIVNTGAALGTTTGYIAIPFPCTMRAEPSLTVNNQTYFRLHSASGGGLAVTAVAIDSGDTTERMAFINATSSGLTAGQATLMVTTDASANGGTLLFDAEL